MRRRHFIALTTALAITTRLAPTGSAAAQQSTKVPRVGVLTPADNGATLAASIAKPGGNITGMSLGALGHNAKGLELLTQARFLA
jgi:ABC-type uncharacterized transport system substrate-binding protein